MNRRGFTLIDSMIGLCLTLLIFVSSLQFFGVGRRIFFKLRAAQEERLNVLAALEKIRLDAGRAGCGLQTPIGLGLAAGLEVQDGVLTLRSEDQSLSLEQDLNVGQTYVSCRSTEDVTRSRTVCFFDETAGEVHSLAAVGRGFILLSAPLEHSYKKEETKVVVLAMDDAGMPTSVDDRWRALERIFAATDALRIPRERIYVDPLVRPVSTNPEQVSQVLGMIRRVREQGGGAKTTCGLSNISFGLPRRGHLNRTFLAMAIGAGLESAILDPLAPGMMPTALAAACLTGEDPFCMHYITAQRQGRL